MRLWACAAFFRHARGQGRDVLREVQGARHGRSEAQEPRLRACASFFRDAWGQDQDALREVQGPRHDRSDKGESHLWVSAAVFGKPVDNFSTRCAGCCEPRIDMKYVSCSCGLARSPLGQTKRCRPEFGREVRAREPGLKRLRRLRHFPGADRPVATSTAEKVKARDLRPADDGKRFWCWTLYCRHAHGFRLFAQVYI